MDVDVDGVRRQRQVERAHRIQPDRHAAAADRLQRAGEHRAAHRPSVDEEHLMRPRGLRQLADADHAANARAALRSVDLDHLLRLLAVHGEQRVAQIAVAKAVVDRGAVVDKAHRHARIADQQPRDRVADQTALVGRLLQKCPAHGDVVEQVAHDKRRAIRAADLLHAQVLPAVDMDPRAGILTPRARRHLDVRDRRDRRKRLAAEAEGPDVVELVRRLQLRRRVVLKRQPHLPRLDAAAIVRHAQIIDSAAADLDGDGRRARVERILHQFLDHRAGPLDDLARRDAADRGRVQYPNRHGFPPSFVQQPRRKSIPAFSDAIFQPSSSRSPRTSGRKPN